MLDDDLTIYSLSDYYLMAHTHRPVAGERSGSLRQSDSVPFCLTRTVKEEERKKERNMTDSRKIYNISISFFFFF